VLAVVPSIRLLLRLIWSVLILGIISRLKFTSVSICFNIHGGAACVYSTHSQTKQRKIKLLSTCKNTKTLLTVSVTDICWTNDKRVSPTVYL